MNPEPLLIEPAFLPMLSPRGVDPLVAPLGDRWRFSRERGVSGQPEVTREGSVAVVRLDGIASRRGSFLMKYLDGYATELLRPTLEALAADAKVSAVVLWIDSPGGQASGVGDAAQAVRELAAVKPVVAKSQGLLCSGAYWIASQADHVMVGADDQVGSIGVLAQMFDTSKAMADAGIEPVIWSTGPFKALGATGAAITPEQRDYVQSQIDGLFAEFKAAVAAGRGLNAEQMDAVTHGGTFTGPEAVKLGLADSVGSFEEAVALAQGLSAQRQPPKEKTKMTAETTAPAVATLAELKGAMPGASADFLVTALEKGLTVEAALSAFASHQAEQLAQVQAELAEALKKAEAVKPAPGVPDGRVAEGTPSTKPANTFLQLVQQNRQDGMSRRDAVMAAVSLDPEAHQVWVESRQ